MVKKIKEILFSSKMMLLLFVLLGGGAAVATFIENDYSTSTARVLVYNNLWYEVVMTLAIVNLLGIIVQRKLWRSKAKFIFHSSFVVMLRRIRILLYARRRVIVDFVSSRPDMR